MEELFNMLSSSARLDKSKKKKEKKRNRQEQSKAVASLKAPDHDDDDGHDTDPNKKKIRSRDRTGKRDTSEAKRLQVHREQVAAFRRSMSIRLANKNDAAIDTPDPISSFQELKAPSWWTANNNGGGSSNDASSSSNNNVFKSIQRAIQANVEAGRWKEPTPIQMQAIPALLERRDFIGAAPTGSGKSGAFILPALYLSGAPHAVFFGTSDYPNDGKTSSPSSSSKKKNKKEKKASRQGEIRSLLVAPSLELAAQIHREVERLGTGKPGGLSCLLLSKSNAPNVISGSAGGKNGLDILVSTPLRLVDSIEKGLRLNSVRIIVLDEADRLLDATDGHQKKKEKKSKAVAKKSASKKHDEDESDDEDDDDVDEEVPMSSGAAAATGGGSSGSMQTRTFLAQMDIILSEAPSSAVRALFSATVTPTVHSLSESILRNPVDVAIAQSKLGVGGANPDISQELTFVGKEEGKLLAIRQLVQRGQLRPPAIVFLESQDRAQALFEELLYDNIHVDVIHAGRSRSAREAAVARFRRGETWVLICTDLVARGVDFRAVNMVINYDLPTSGITYVHRIGRCGRAGRKGTAITLFTEADFEHLRTIANVMRQSGCKVEEWMLNLKQGRGRGEQKVYRPRNTIDTTPIYDKKKKRKRMQMIQDSKNRARKQSGSTNASPKKDAPK